MWDWEFKPECKSCAGDPHRGRSAFALCLIAVLLFLASYYLMEWRQDRHRARALNRVKILNTTSHESHPMPPVDPDRG